MSRRDKNEFPNSVAYFLYYTVPWLLHVDRHVVTHTKKIYFLEYYTTDDTHAQRIDDTGISSTGRTSLSFETEVERVGGG